MSRFITNGLIITLLCMSTLALGESSPLVLPVARSPRAIAVSPNGDTVYVAGGDCTNTSERPGEITHIATSPLEIHSTRFAAGCPESMAFSPDGLFLYVANPTSTEITIVNTQAHQIVGKLMTDQTRPQLLVMGHEHQLYVVGLQNNSRTGESVLLALDTTSKQIKKRLDFHGWPKAMVISPNGQTIYLALGSGHFQAIDALNAKTVIDREMQGHIDGLAISADGQRLYAVLTLPNGKGAIEVLDAATLKTINTFQPIGRQLSDIALTADNEAYLISEN